MEYWIRLDGEQIGPLTLEEARRLPLKPDTPVWIEGMEDWATAREIVALADLFAGEPTQPGTPPLMPEREPVHPYDGEVIPGKGCSPICLRQQIDLTGCPNNNMGMSVAAIVVLTAFCGVLGLLGLVPLLNSIKVEKLFLTGQPDLAAACANKAKNWSIACYIIAGVLTLLAMIVVSFVGTEALINASGGNPSFLGL